MIIFSRFACHKYTIQIKQAQKAPPTENQNIIFAIPTHPLFVYVSSLYNLLTRSSLESYVMMPKIAHNFPTPKIPKKWHRPHSNNSMENATHL